MVIVAGGCNRQPHSVKPKKKTPISFSRTSEEKAETNRIVVSDSSEIAVENVPAPTLSVSTISSQNKSANTIIVKDTPIPEERIKNLRRFSPDHAKTERFSRIQKEAKAPRKEQYSIEKSNMSEPPKNH